MHTVFERRLDIKSGWDIISGVEIQREREFNAFSTRLKSLGNFDEERERQRIEAEFSDLSRESEQFERHYAPKKLRGFEAVIEKYHSHATVAVLGSSYSGAVPASDDAGGGGGGGGGGMLTSHAPITRSVDGVASLSERGVGDFEWAGGDDPGAAAAVVATDPEDGTAEAVLPPRFWPIFVPTEARRRRLARELELSRQHERDGPSRPAAAGGRNAEAAVAAQRASSKRLRARRRWRWAIRQVDCFATTCLSFCVGQPPKLIIFL